MPPTAIFWSLLMTAAAQPISLNHFYVTLDAPVYAAIAHDTFLRGEFAPSEERTTVRTDSKYTGLYFYGQSTYFEFFGAGLMSDRKAGDSAIAFGVDGAGGLDKVAARLHAGTADREVITREWNGRQWPWFVRLAPPFQPRFHTWLMEYDPQFLANWRPSAVKSNQGITRAKILERYADVLPDHPKDAWLGDVEAITVSLDAPSAAMFRDFERGLGSPAVKITVHEEAHPRGITSVGLRLRKAPQSERVLRFGPRCTLKLTKSGSAEWTF
jgi:Family of unknown function (DUF5829)